MTEMEKDVVFMQEALKLAQKAMDNGNEPFGAILVKNDVIVFSNENQIHSENDPTFHAEHGLIREFCRQNKIMDLSKYTLYTSCEPCFMCSGAMVWAKLGRLVFSASAKDLDFILGEKAETEPSKIVFSHSIWEPKVTNEILREDGVKLLGSYFTNI